MSKDDYSVLSLFSEGHSKAWPWLVKCEQPWEILPQIHSIVLELGKSLDSSEYSHPRENIWIANDVAVPNTATIMGPVIIDHGTEIRPGAYIRGNVLVGRNCVVGNSCELKNCILFDGVQVPHFNYVGDSVLGYLSHMGAGAVTSNLKSDKSKVSVYLDGIKTDTGLDKMGAILGDCVEIGCNAVLNPGTVVGKNSRVYPTSSVRGFVPANSIFKYGTGYSIVPMTSR